MNDKFPIKFIYDDVKITIRIRYKKFYLDFMHNNKRIKRTTSLIANEKNLNTLKKDIIPELIVALTGNKEIEYLKKDIYFIDFANKFFDLYQGTVREHVFSSNHSIFNKHIKPYFLNNLISNIKPIELEEWQNNLIKRKYSVFTIIRYRSILNLILQKAFDNNIIEYNPLSKVKSPNALNKKFRSLFDLENDNSLPFNKSEIIKMLNNTKGNLYYFIFIMISTGMRPGEIISLTWKDIDFVKKRIAVDKTIVRGKIGEVKTESSVRFVDIIPILENQLKALYDLKISDKFLFLSNYRKPFQSHTSIARRFKLLLNKLHINERDMYNLRHTFASNMISEGQNILWVSKMLGHRDISITLKTYAKFVKEDEDKRLDNISKIVPIYVPNIN